MKNKTLAAWLAFLGGPLGLHRFYLHGLGDLPGWLLPIPTALGLYGVQRVQRYGVDDGWSWVLIPLLGFTIAGCALTAIIYGKLLTLQSSHFQSPVFRLPSWVVHVQLYAHTPLKPVDCLLLNF